MQLSTNCYGAIEECLGGQYFVGNLRATCRHISANVPKATEKFMTEWNFLKQCCKRGSIPDIDVLLSSHPSLCSKTTYWAAKYGRLEILQWAVDNELRFFHCPPDDILAGAAGSGSVDTLIAVYNFYEKFFHRTAWLYGYRGSVYYSVGCGGSIEIFKKIFTIIPSTRLDCLIYGAVKHNRFEIFEYMLNNYQISENNVTHALVCNARDSLEWLILAAKYIHIDEWVYGLSKENTVHQHFYNSRAYKRDTTDFSGIEW